VLPFTGLGVVACLTLATALAVGAVLGAERLRPRGDRPAAEPAPPRRRRSMSPLAAAALTLGAVVVLIYVIWVISTA
jgi:hypothetical protein